MSKYLLQAKEQIRTKRLLLSLHSLVVSNKWYYLSREINNNICEPDSL